LEETAERRAAGLDAAGGQAATQLLDGQVRRFDQHGDDPRGVGLERRAFPAAVPVWDHDPRRRQRCISLITKLTLTLNLAAVARRDAPPSTERTTRSRRSTEYGRVIHRWPPRPGDQLNHNNLQL
jgi:hypothetical protein